MATPLQPIADGIVAAVVRPWEVTNAVEVTVDSNVLSNTHQTDVGGSRTSLPPKSLHAASRGCSTQRVLGKSPHMSPEHSRLLHRPGARRAPRPCRGSRTGRRPRATRRWRHDVAESPVTWSETENVKWKTPVHGRAWCSPVVWDNQVWMTTATEDGHELGVVSLDAKTGKPIHDRKLYDVEKPQFAHKFNSRASPTPAIEAGRMYVSSGQRALPASGRARRPDDLGAPGLRVQPLPRRRFLADPVREPAAPELDGSDHQFIVALDKKTGKTAWRKETLESSYKDLGPDGKPEWEEGDWRKAFAACPVSTLNGVPTLLSQGAKAFYGYNPKTGDELWRVEEHTVGSGTRPAVGHGFVFIPSGWSRARPSPSSPAPRAKCWTSMPTRPPDRSCRWSGRRRGYPPSRR